MKAFLTAVAVAATLASPAAFAQERVADAALGGLSGALVLGPVGAVAGIIVGYTAGPSISRSWGASPDYRYPDRVAQRPLAPRSSMAAAKQVKSASAVSAKPISGAAYGSAASVKNGSAAPAKPAAETKPVWDAPPVMGFE